MKKLGLVLECDAGGPDELALTCIVRRLSPGTEVHCVTRGSKHGIFNGGAEAAAALVEAEKCDLVLIVWDLKPLWEEVEAEDCEDEAEELNKKLEAVSAATRKKIRLLCLTYELETWLIAEDRAVRGYLSTPEHKSKFKAPSDLLSKTDPKRVLSNAFKATHGQRYEDYREAIRLVQLWPDTSRVGAIDSFTRFSKLLTGSANAVFQECGEVCADLAYQAKRMGRA